MVENRSISINQSVAILCDGLNIKISIHDSFKSTKLMPNFDKIIPKILHGRSLNRFFYFTEEKNVSIPLQKRFSQKYFGSIITNKKSIDIPLTIKAIQLASKVDTIILMSGDKDFVELASHLKTEGVRVEVASIRKTTAKALIDICDYYHPIRKDDCWEHKENSEER